MLVGDGTMALSYFVGSYTVAVVGGQEFASSQERSGTAQLNLRPA